MRVVYWAWMGFAKQPLIAGLRGVPECELIVCENLTQLFEALPGAHALVLFDPPAADARQVTQALSAPGNTVRWMHFISAGREAFDAVGLPAGVTVTCPAGATSPAVAEHAMALLLALNRRVPELITQAAECRWDRGLALRSISLEGATMVIIGLGHIGGELAHRARAFGMRIVAVTRSPKHSDTVDEVHGLEALHAALSAADVIAVTLQLTRETRHVIGPEALAACKRGAILINVARGGLIDQAAMCAALCSGQLGGAGLDATDPEPLPKDDPLWTCPNVLISPHTASSGSAAGVARTVSGAIENLQRLRSGLPLLHVVA